MCGQQVTKKIKTSHQHIIIKHIDNIYKWKAIREKTTSYYCCDAKESSNSLSPLIFCRLQPTGGYYLKLWKLQLARKLQLPSIFCRLQPIGGSNLNHLELDIYQATNWNRSTKSNVFSVGYNPQEAPTSTNSNWTSIKIQLETEGPTPMYFIQVTTHRRLLPQLLQATTCKDAPTPIYFLQAPTSTSSNWTSIKLQLEMEAPTPMHYNKK